MGGFAGAAATESTMNNTRFFLAFVFVAGVLSACTGQPTPLSLTSTPVVSQQASATIVSTISDGLTHYQGPNPYRSSPSFDVGYDPSVWEYVEDDGSGRQSQLMHRSLSGCSVWLRAGPVGAAAISTVSLAEYDWTISQIQPNILMYLTLTDDIAFIFGLILPDAYSVKTRSPCQQAAEEVIKTFKIVRQ